MKSKKALATLLILVLTSTVVFGGCSSGGKGKADSTDTKGVGQTNVVSEDKTREGTTSDSAAAADTSEHVDLVMYLIGSEDNSYDRIQKALNEKLEADLNCTMTIKYIGFGEFSTKYGLILSSGEQIDLIYTAGWLNMNKLADDGAYMDIAELMPVYMPKTAAEIDMDSLLKKDNGHIYYLPSNYTAYGSYGYIVRKDVREQLGYDKVDNFGTFLEFMTRANTELGFQDSLSQAQHEYDMHHCLINNYIGITNNYYMNRETHEVFYISEIPELQDWFKSVQDWSKKGAWSMSVLSNTDTERMAAGTAAGWIHNMDTFRNLCVAHPEYEFEFCSLEVPKFYYSSFGHDNMAVGSSSKNPGRALMVLEKFRQDESYYNLLTFGEKGVDYEITSEGLLKQLNSDNFTYDNGTWGFRDDKFYRELEGTPQAYLDFKKEVMEDPDTQLDPMRLFTAKTAPVKAELAAVDNVWSQYYVPFSLGYVDYETGLQQVTENLKIAGNDKVKEEFQRQVDEYFEIIMKE